MKQNPIITGLATTILATACVMGCAAETWDGTDPNPAAETGDEEGIDPNAENLGTNVQALSGYNLDGTNPVACSNESVVTKATKSLIVNGVNRGTVYLRYSPTCRTFWSKIVLPQPATAALVNQGEVVRYGSNNRTLVERVATGNTSCYTAQLFDDGSPFMGQIFSPPYPYPNYVGDLTVATQGDPLWWPASKIWKLSSKFGPRTPPCWTDSNGVRQCGSAYHNGIDIPAGSGTPIIAAKSGTVSESRFSSSFGNTILIDHGNGLTTRYAHASARYVSQWQKVTAGQTIAAVGNTGNSGGFHLHFEVRENGVATNPCGKYLSCP
jgi:murein DD-endopeptidase MepM/ murein hydrolase activator NlpD